MVSLSIPFPAGHQSKTDKLLDNFAILVFSLFFCLGTSPLFLNHDALTAHRGRSGLPEILGFQKRYPKLYLKFLINTCHFGYLKIQVHITSFT
jgi:hypothetical protein